MQPKTCNLHSLKLIGAESGAGFTFLHVCLKDEKDDELKVGDSMVSQFSALRVRLH